MPSAVRRASVAFGRLLDALASLAAIILLAMVVIVSADIILRNIIGAGFAWANETSEYALYVMTLLTAPWLLRRGQHVRLDIALTFVAPRIAWLMEALGDVLGFAVCATLLAYGIDMVLESARLGAITIKILVFPEWWLLAPLPAAFFLLAIEFMFRFYRLMEGERTRRIEATSVS
jgi:TRAP-type C4-dicarboxylate transport system permease small subunit